MPFSNSKHQGCVITFPRLQLGGWPITSSELLVSCRVSSKDLPLCHAYYDLILRTTTAQNTDQRLEEAYQGLSSIRTSMRNCSGYSSQDLFFFFFFFSLDHGCSAGKQLTTTWSNVRGWVRMRGDKLSQLSLLSHHFFNHCQRRPPHPALHAKILLLLLQKLSALTHTHTHCQGHVFLSPSGFSHPMPGTA